MVLGEVEGAAVAFDGEVEREIGAEAVLRLHPKPEVIEVVGARFGDVEDAQDGDGATELHGGRVTQG